MSDSENELTIDIKKNENQKSLPSTSLYEIMDIKEGTKLVDESGELSDSSDDNLSESSFDRCAICLGRIKGKIGSPDAEGCEHYFCLLCILEWTKTNPTCPQDRRAFEKILVKESVNGEVIYVLQANKNVVEEEDLEVENPTYCEVCGSCEREDCLLLCDGCDLGYHLECLTPPLMEVPIEEWFCPLCVAADLPIVVRKAASENVRQKPPKRSRKKGKISKILKRRTRMIPRTRASERVLRRIERTRFKEIKKQNKNEEKEKQFVHLFSKARPFGSIADDDVDAAFNDDEYADKLLSSSTVLSNNYKKEYAAKNFSLSGAPLPSYAGRAFHPKVDDGPSSSTDTDILINILEDQDVLLTKSKHVSLTKERKLIKKEGAKVMEFNVDRENRIMSELLPSQKKAKEIEIKVKAEIKEKQREEENLKREQDTTRDNNSSNSNKHNNRHHYHGYKSRDKNKSFRFESHKDNQSKYRSHHSSSNRKREEKNYDYRDSRSYRERSRSRDTSDKSRDKSDDHKITKDHCTQSEYRLSSRSREKQRSSSQHNGHSRSSNKRRDHHKSSSISFWENNYIDTFSKNNSDNQKDSLHTTDVYGIQENNQNLNQLKCNDELKISNNDKNSENNLIAENISFTKSDNIRLESKINGDYMSEADKHIIYPVKESKENITSFGKRKERDFSSASQIDHKKQRLKSLFGDDFSSGIDHSKQDASPHPAININNSESIIKPNNKDTYYTIDSANSSLESVEILSPSNNKHISPSLKIESGKEKKNMKFSSKEHLETERPSSPSLPSCPNYTLDPVEDDLGDITYLSKSSMDLILNGLSRYNKQRNEDCRVTANNSESPNTYAEIEDKSSVLDSSHKENEQQPCKGGINITKRERAILDHESDELTIKSIFDKSKKKITTLFGDFSDSDASIPEAEKKSTPKHTNKISSENIPSTSKLPEEISVAKNMNRNFPSSLNESKIESDGSDVHKVDCKDTKQIQKNTQEGLSDKKTAVPASKAKVNKVQLETKVVAEAKKYLNPYYAQKGFSKEIYKEIVSKCVNKVLEVECSNTVDPKKIQKLVDGYVQLYMHRNKKTNSEQENNL